MQYRASHAVYASGSRQMGMSMDMDGVISVKGYTMHDTRSVRNDVLLRLQSEPAV